MLERLRRRLTYANVVSTVAVVGMLAGGGAYAASKIGAKDIAKNAIRSKHVKNASLTAVDIDASGLPVAKAWAEITPGGGVRAALGMSQSDVSHPTNVIPAGLYCINVAAENASATGGIVPGEGIGEVTIYSRASLMDGGNSPADFGCPAETPWVVLANQDGVAKNSYFQVLFH
jgi:hypothetical protein